MKEEVKNRSLASEIVADLQEKIEVLQGQADLKEQCVQSILEIKDNLTLYYLYSFIELVKKDRSEVDGADAYICATFFSLVELLEKKPDEKTAKLVYQLINRLR